MSNISNLDELKLTQVVLFKAGIGSFQKQGQINLNRSKTVKISFKNSVMNDLLKTFSIRRLTGDLQVSGVSYEAQEINSSKMLEDSEINLPEQDSLTSLIKQLRGVSVTFKNFEEEITGRIIGIQTFEAAPTGQAIIEQDHVLLALYNNTIKPIPISEITGIKIIDPKIEKDFQFFMETITGKNKEKNKIITLFFNGKEQSEYILNFLQEVPAWKTSYRIFIDKQPNQKRTKQSKDMKIININLQGWAIIDNVLDEDWENVDLTLVTGLPVSFVYDSYSPAWIQRPTVERKTDLGVKVVQFERGDLLPNKGLNKRAAKPMAKMRSPMPPPSMSSGNDMFFAEEPLADFKDEEGFGYAPEPKPTFESSSVTEGGKGLAFKYHIKHPVFVKRNNSSLIPLLQEDLEGSIISVYNKKMNENHPLETLEFQNEGLTLEEGPISLFIDKNFAGEAMLPFIDGNITCRIPFAMDQAVLIDLKQISHQQNFHEINIDKDIYKRYFETKHYTYNIKNLSKDSRTLYIEHPIEKNFELYDTVEPNETTPSYYRFKLDLSNESSTILQIKVRKLSYAHQEASHLTKKIISDWKKLGLIKKPEFEYLSHLIDLELQLQTKSQKRSDLENKKNVIFNEQERLRKNINALQTSEAEKNLREKYISKLDEQENQIEAIQIDITNSQKQIQKINQDKEELIKKWTNDNQEDEK